MNKITFLTLLLSSILSVAGVSTNGVSTDSSGPRLYFDGALTTNYLSASKTLYVDSPTEGSWDYGGDIEYLQSPIGWSCGDATPMDGWAYLTNFSIHAGVSYTVEYYASANIGCNATLGFGHTEDHWDETGIANTKFTRTLTSRGTNALYVLLDASPNKGSSITSILVYSNGVSTSSIISNSRTY